MKNAFMATLGKLAAVAVVGIVLGFPAWRVYEHSVREAATNKVVSCLKARGVQSINRDLAKQMVDKGHDSLGNAGVDWLVQSVCW